MENLIFYGICTYFIENDNKFMIENKENERKTKLLDNNLSCKKQNNELKNFIINQRS